MSPKIFISLNFTMSLSSKKSTSFHKHLCKPQFCVQRAIYIYTTNICILQVKRHFYIAVSSINLPTNLMRNAYVYKLKTTKFKLLAEG